MLFTALVAFENNLYVGNGTGSVYVGKIQIRLRHNNGYKLGTQGRIFHSTDLGETHGLI